MKVTIYFYLSLLFRSRTSRGMELIQSTAGVISPRLQRIQETVVKVATATGEYLTNRNTNPYNNACSLQ